MDYDLVITGGTVIDGSGQPRYRADVGIFNGRIAAVVPPEKGTLSSRRMLEASGKIVAPGFIDIHSHADWVLPQRDHEVLAPLVLQGITTVVTGNCGFSPAPVLPERFAEMSGFSRLLRDDQFPYTWGSFGEFLGTLERNSLLLNAAFLVGHGTLRLQVLGARPDAPTGDELNRMQQLARDALRDGAFGFSAGLAYPPGLFARNDELSALLKVVAEEGGLFTVHGRAYTWVSPFYRPMFFGAAHNLHSVRELIGLARQANISLQLSHLIFVGRRTWGTYKAVLDEIERSVATGVDVGFDAFPYTVGNSTITVVFPEWFMKDFEKNINDPAALRKVKREFWLLQTALGFGPPDIRLMVGVEPELSAYEGMNFAQIGEKLGMSPLEAYLHIARRTHGEATILLGAYSGDGDREQALRSVLSHPLCAFMTDTVLTRRGFANPASYGTFPRVLGRYSRELGLITLEEAVRRMTSYSAQRIGLKEVGRIAEGYWADLTIFDPQTVKDNGWPQQSNVPPSGIDAVIISGELAAHAGRLIPGVRCGRVLRRT